MQYEKGETAFVTQLQEHEIAAAHSTRATRSSTHTPILNGTCKIAMCTHLDTVFIFYPTSRDPQIPVMVYG